MEEFYASASRKYQESIEKQNEIVREQWKQSVLSEAEKGIPPSGVTCKFNFRPRPEVVKELETKDIKLEIVHEPSRVEDDSTPYSNTLPRYIDEAYYIRTKRPEVQSCSIQ